MEASVSIILLISLLGFSGAFVEEMPLFEQPSILELSSTNLSQARSPFHVDDPISQPGDLPFHIYANCQPLLDEFRIAATAFTNCTLENAIPPVLCTACTDEYVEMMNVYDRVIQDSNITTLGLRCSQVLTDSYIYSFVQTTYNFNVNLWDTCHCNSCISIFWDSLSGTTFRNTSYTKALSDYEIKLSQWRQCVAGNMTGDNEPSTNVCKNCKMEYKTLYTFYWDNYVYKKDALKCIDIESTMNDTIGMWRGAWNCTVPPSAKSYRRPQTAAVLSICFSVLCLPAVFYVVMYLIGTTELKNLLKYSETADARTYRTQSVATGVISVRPTMMNTADLASMYLGTGATPSMSASQRELFVRQSSGDSLDAPYGNFLTTTPKKRAGRKVTRIEEDENENASSSSNTQPSDSTQSPTTPPNGGVPGPIPTVTVLEHL